MGCIHKRAQGSSIKAASKVNSSGLLKHSSKSLNLTCSQQTSDIKIELQFFQEDEENKVQLKIKPASELDEGFEENQKNLRFSQKQTGFCAYQENEILKQSKKVDVQELEKEINEVIRLYGEKYPLNSSDLRETQVIVSPDFPLNSIKEIGKPLNISIKKGQLSVIFEESEFSGSSSILFNGRESQLIIIEASEVTSARENKRTYQRARSILKN